MEINEVNKVSTRKRINVEVEKLREKVSRETNKIIKLKVAQDTAYWDLKEKLQQVEGNHERLQQNMVEVQMQHEAISGQYQEELRLRPETLNKLNSSREICGVLQDYSEKLKETLSRCKADQAALCEAYHRSGELVRKIKQNYHQTDEKNIQMISSLEEKEYEDDNNKVMLKYFVAKLASEHQNQLLQMFTVFKEQANSEVVELKGNLKDAQANNKELTNTISDLKSNLDVHKFELQKRDDEILNLQKEIKHITDEFSSERAWTKTLQQRKEKDLKDAHEEIESLKQALTNQDDYTKSVNKQNVILEDKIAALQEEHRGASELINDLKVQIERATNIYNNIKEELKVKMEDKERCEMELSATIQRLNKSNEESFQLKKKLQITDTEKTSIVQNLEILASDSNCKTAKIDELNSIIKSQVKRIEELENAFNTYKSSAEDKIQDLSRTVEVKDKELDLKANTISQLMSEIKTGTDLRSKLETSLERLKREMEIEKEADKEERAKMTNKIENLEASVKNKEESLSKQMSLIFEMRNEKERLHSKIGSMQNTIDNIQKELTGRPPPPQADLDDNAIMLTPARKGAPKSPVIPKNKFVVPRTDPPMLDNAIFGLFSDSSVDGGDTLDSAEINRRFHAISRGERVSPRPLASLKRRSGVPAVHGGSRIKKDNDEGAISLSQVKNKMNNKERNFFKTKRNDLKQRKL